jgi:lipopolysaccharide/colanic/teichoic acid biosynthesis glycosyltransferase
MNMNQTGKNVLEEKILGENMLAESVFDGMVMSTESAQLVRAKSEVSPDITWTPNTSYYVCKRAMDIVLAMFGILVLSPLFLLVALLIKLDDGGPVLHFREIIGFRGQRFHALKFRTMIVNADEYLSKHPELMKQYQENMKLVRDPRVTRIGMFLRKTSIDELPQLFNVLVGQMSLVGPRMIHPSELSRYGVYAEKRLAVKPGITGLWQISGRQHVSYDERIILDVRYIDNRSFLMDVIIVLKTLKVFVVHTGA